MLTEQAIERRKWGDFPALQEHLASKPASGRRYGAMSTSDNIFEYLRRLIEIVDRTDEYKLDLLEAAKAGGPDVRIRIADDLESLRQKLAGILRSFESDVARVESVRNEIYETR